MKALIVQNDPETLSLLAERLSLRGHEPTALPDAEEGWDAFQSERFPLVILNWMPPDTEGLELCRRIREAGADTSVILIVNGRTEPEHVVAALDAGANDFVSRPFSLELLDLRLAIAERQVDEMQARKAAQEALAHRALHDPLTDLPNRALFWDRLEQAMRLGQRTRSPVAVLILDLDGFKDVNDTFGHTVGDSVLQVLASRLNNSTRASDTVARIGGDEFAFVLPTADALGSSTFAQKVLRTVAEPIRLEGPTVAVEASIGIAVYPHDGQDGQALVRRADEAMYRAKQSRAGYALFDPAQDGERMNRFFLTEQARGERARSADE